MRLSELTDKKLINDYSLGLSLRRISKDNSLSHVTLYNHFKKKEIKLRGTHEQRIKMQKYDKQFFNIIDTQKKAYWLGFILADGCIYKKSNSKDSHIFEFRLATKDYSHLEKFCQDIKTNTKPRINNNRARLFLCYSELCKSLISKGCIPRKTFVLVFPKFLKKQLYSHFIRGYWDGDGSVYRNKSFIGWNLVGNKAFLENVAKILRKVSKAKLTVFKVKRSYLISCYGRFKIFKILDWLYKNSKIHLDRKYQRYILYKNE